MSLFNDNAGLGATYKKSVKVSKGPIHRGMHTAFTLHLNQLPEWAHLLKYSTVSTILRYLYLLEYFHFLLFYTANTNILLLLHYIYLIILVTLDLDWMRHQSQSEILLFLKILLKILLNIFKVTDLITNLI